MKRIMRWGMTGLGTTLSLVLVSAAFGQETGVAIPTSQRVGIAPPAPASMPVLTDPSTDRWRISETIAQSRKDQPVFFGVRLANAPQAALAEIYSQSYTAGETLAVRLWGCNDLPKEFKGRVQVALKQGNKQFTSEEKTVRLAPETVKRLAKYSFDTDDLAAGQYALETSLFDNAGALVQQQVITVTIRVTHKQDLSRRNVLAKAEAEEQAVAKKAELKAKADLSRRSALAKGEAKAQAQAAEKTKKEADQKAKVDLEQKAEADAKAKKAELKAKAEAEEQAAADLKAQAQAAEKAKKDLSRRSALAKGEAELKAKVD
ncbi:MAG: hypothetical protein Q8O57_01550, partial [Kiritimatiellota bacterium]|nr:hypothetical protein [Kiritimatiellota bacterium]